MQRIRILIGILGAVLLFGMSGSLEVPPAYGGPYWWVTGAVAGLGAVMVLVALNDRFWT